MKKIFGFMVLAIAIFALSSCGGGNTPSAVAEKAVKCIQAEDYEGYVNLMNIEVKEGEDIENAKTMLVALMKEKGGKSMKEKEGIKSYEILSEEIAEDGNTAVVKVKIVYGNGTEDEQKIKLVKDKDGEWKLSDAK